jgi:peptidoglycan/LPS O-acetylase OafA/YrhL
MLTKPDEALNLLSESALLYNYSDLYSFWLNSSLWSMKNEIVASLILFVFVLGSKRPLIFLGAFIALVSLVDLDPVARQYLQFLMFFAAGAWLAVSKFRPSRWVANGLVLLGLFAFTMPWVLRGWDHEWASPGLELYSGLVGAIALGFGVLGDSGFRKFLETKPLQFLGSRSYSIYLVHAPIVTLAGFGVLNLTGSIVSWFWYAPFVVVAAVLLGDLFHRVVEVTTLRLSRSIRSRPSANSK